VQQRQQRAVHAGVEARQIAQAARAQPSRAELFQEERRQGQLEQDALLHRLGRHAAEEGEAARRGDRRVGDGARRRVELVRGRRLEEARAVEGAATLAAAAAAVAILWGGVEALA
jgi:hypothetical protein